MNLPVVIVLIVCLSPVLCANTLDLVCKTDAECSGFEDKMVVSHCHDSSCKCANRKSNESVSCVPKVLTAINKLGMDCRIHHCIVPHSICDEGQKCRCEKNFIESPDSLRCLPATVQLSKPCEMNEQCVKYDSNAYCSADKSCQCLGNFTLHDNSCRSLVRIGQQCHSSEECHKFTSNATCLEHKCACDKNFVSSENGDSCLLVGFHLDDCVQVSQCLSGLGVGSICDNGKCVCDEIHENKTDGDRTICQRRVMFGDVCKEHTDCAFYLGDTTMECFQYRCRCRGGFELFDAYDKKCVKKSGGFIHLPSTAFVIVAASIGLRSFL